MAEKPKQISLRDNAQESLDYLVEILKDNKDVKKYTDIKYEYTK